MGEVVHVAGPGVRKGCRVTTGQVLILFAGVCLAWLAVLIVWSSR
jgi:hypothetical protein